MDAAETETVVDNALCLDNSLKKPCTEIMNITMLRSYLAEKSKHEVLDFVNLRDASCRPRIVTAALAGDAELVHFLIDLRADIEAVTKSGQTALLVACKKGCAAVVEQLLRAKAQVQVQDTVKRATPLVRACQEGPLGKISYPKSVLSYRCNSLRMNLGLF